MKTLNWWAAVEAFLWTSVAVTVVWVLILCGAATADWWRTRNDPDTDDTAAPVDTITKTRMVEMTVHLNDVESLTYVTEWPVKVEDLAALRVLIARKVGPVWTAPIFNQFLDSIAEREAVDLDAELADLGGAA